MVTSPVEFHFVILLLTFQHAFSNRLIAFFVYYSSLCRTYHFQNAIFAYSTSNHTTYLRHALNATLCILFLA